MAVGLNIRKQPVPAVNSASAWAWWLYGRLIYQPWHRLWCRLSWGRHTANGYRRSIGGAIRDWCWKTMPGKSLRGSPVRWFVYRLTLQDRGQTTCPNCGYRDFTEHDGYVEVEASGQNYDGDYWWSGYVTCCRCGYRTDYYD